MQGKKPGHSALDRRFRRSDGFATRAIRVGQEPCSATGATIVPIYQTATFTLDDIGVDKGYDYSRTGNPTRSALERQIADLEDARFGTAFASGMAAIAGACSLLRSGDHVVATRGLYGGTYRLLTQVLPRYGITATFVDTAEVAAVAASVTAATKLFWIETPTNPLLHLSDIAAIAALKAPHQLLAVDNTFCSPYFQRPLNLGADLVIHSATKYINGHSDVVGGIVVTNENELAEQIAFHQNAVGAIPGPQDAYLTIRGVKTLALRMQQHERNAIAVAHFLEARRDVGAVYYPGLRSHPQYELASRQQSGFGGVVSFRIGSEERARAFARAVRVFNFAVSLGGVESLVCLPAFMTHGSLPAQERDSLGITNDLIRLSVGIEETDDLLADIDEALAAAADVGEPSARDSELALV